MTADTPLADTSPSVESGDAEAATERYAEDASLIATGVTECGLLSRQVSGTVVLDVFYAVECSVLLVERTRDRSVWARFLS